MPEKTITIISMRVLMLSRDRNTVTPGTAAFARMEMYRTLVDDLRVVFVDFSMSLHRVWNIARAQKPELVTVPDPFEAGCVGFLLAKKFGARFEVQVHTDIFSPEFYRESLWNKCHVLLARFILPRADTVRVVSARVRDGIVAHSSVGPSKIHVRPIAVDVEKIRTAPVSTYFKDRYLQFGQIALMASRLTKEKNIDLAIRAFAQIANTVPSLGLVIVGDGPEKERLRQLTVSLGVSLRVVFEPWRTDLPSLMKSATFFVATSRYEGYGLSIMEAAAAGCPIVTTDVGCVGNELPRDAACVIPVGDTGACARAFVSLSRDASARSEYSRRAGQATNCMTTPSEYLEATRKAWNESGEIVVH